MPEVSTFMPTTDCIEFPLVTLVRMATPVEERLVTKRSVKSIPASYIFPPVSSVTANPPFRRTPDPTVAHTHAPVEESLVVKASLAAAFVEMLLFPKVIDHWNCPTTYIFPELSREMPFP